MNNNFPLNRYNFSNLIKTIQEVGDLSHILVDEETGIEFYGINDVSREYLIKFLSEFNSLDNLAQKDSEKEYENNSHHTVDNYQFEPSWVKVSLNKVEIGYVGIYVNTDFSLDFEKTDEWILVK